MKKQLWTVTMVLKWTMGYFASHGIEQPRTDAEVLLAHVLECERIDLYLNFDQPLTKKELALYRKVIKRRVSHEPVQYIIAKQEFWSLPIKVTPVALIPRVETECLVEATINIIREEIQERKLLRILDVGTGSGAIALALAKEIKDILIFASDCSTGALFLARENAQNLDLLGRINYFASDLFGCIKVKINTLFDFIVSNPPYISRNDFEKLPPEIRKYEPQTALDGGRDGLYMIRRIITESEHYLRPMGYLVVEIGSDQGKQIREITNSLSWVKKVEIIKDYSGLDRILTLQKSG